jgi:hypothetical protein
MPASLSIRDPNLLSRPSKAYDVISPGQSARDMRCAHWDALGWVKSGEAMKNLLFAVLMFASMFAVGQTAHAQSLTETEQWINQTSKNHGLFQQFDRQGILQVGYVEQFTLNQCQMTQHFHESADGATTKEMYVQERNSSFSLKEIDPTTITVVPFATLFMGDCTDHVEAKALDCSTQAEVRFRARNDNPVISYESTTIFAKLTGKDREFRNSGKDNSGAFSLWDTAYAERFAKAFRHAVELCGGTKSAF